MEKCLWFLNSNLSLNFHFSIWLSKDLWKCLHSYMFHSLTLLIPMNGEGNGTPLQYSCLENPWMEEPGRLRSMGSRRVRHDWATSLSLFYFHALEKEMATHSSVLAWRIPRMTEPVGLPSMGSHRVGHDWSDLAAAYHAEHWFEQIYCKKLWLKQE